MSSEPQKEPGGANPATSSSTTAKQTLSPDDVLKRVQTMKELIWQRRPILGQIMKEHGEKILYEYSRDFMDVNRAPVLDPFKHELIDVTSELIGKRLGDDVGKKVKKQLESFALVSTADHHAFIDHPFWVNANIISGLPFLDHPHPDVFSLIVLSFASVSLNNASGYPRGILFHGGMGNSSNLIRLPLLPDKQKMGIVYSCPAFTKEDLARAKASLQNKVREGAVAAQRAEQIGNLMDEHFGTEAVLNSTDLSEQVTKVNYTLWPQCFHEERGYKNGNKPMMDLLYLEIETLVTELLYRRHLTNDTLINRILFDEEYRALALKHFNNVPGGFSTDGEGWGSFMFWAIDFHLHRVRLELEGNRLVSKSRPELSVDFTPEGIEKALREKRIYPGMLLCYIIVSFYYGMKCLGGFCQVHDLTIAKQRFGDMLTELGEDKEAEALLPVQTKELGGDGMVLAYTRSGAELFPATGIDMILSDRNTTVEKYVERSKMVTLTEMMNPMVPEMYTVLYPSFERDAELTAVTPEDIIKATGLLDKLERHNAQYVRS